MRSLNEFKANIDNLGIVKQNRFEVWFARGQMSWPTSPRDLTFRCESVNLPGTQILTTDYKLYGGQPITKIPNGRGFDEVQMTFLTTGDMRDKYWFDEWIDKITDHTNNTVAYYNDVSSNISIDIFNEVENPANRRITGAQVIVDLTKPNTSPNQPTGVTFSIDSGVYVIPIYTVTLIKAIPNRVETVQLSWESSDQFLKYSVNFSYESLKFESQSNVTQLEFKHLDKVQK